MESNVNKMNLSNLGMIFCSTLRIDRFCFNWLVNSWADCWAGCLTEEDEYNRTLPTRLPSTESANRPQIPSSDSRTSSRTGRTVELDGSSQERWPSTSSRDQPASSSSSIVYPPRTDSRERPLPVRTDSRERPGHVDFAALKEELLRQKEKMDRRQESEKEPERGQGQVRVEIRRHRKEPSSLSLSVRSDEGPHYDDRYSTMVQTGGSPRQSLDYGRLGAPSPLPPIQPLSPMMKEGQNVV
jgi:hypothetical protein